jgi:tape measure domain-containing protein
MIAGSIEIQLMASVARLQRDMAAARQVVGDATAGMARAAEMAKTALAGIGLGAGLSHIVQLSDEYSKFTAQLRLATSGARAYAQAYADVKRIATSSQADLGATGALYAQVTRATSSLGVSQQAVADITESVNLAFKISGAGAQETSGAIIQLSQAFASGALRGDEFNSVNEAAPRLMQAIADSIGVPVAALRDMAAQGQLTSALIAKALPQALGQLRSEADQMQTIAGAFTVLKNNVMEFTGAQAQASGAVTVATTVIGGLANNLTLVAGASATVAAVRLGTWLDNATTKGMENVAANRALAASTLSTAEANATATAQASLLANARLAEVRAATLAASGETQLALTTNALIPAQARAAAAAEAHALAMSQLSIAQRAASIGASATSSVIAALGGPIGALILILGVAATAWSWYKEKQDEATAKSGEQVGQTTAEIIANIEKQNEKLRERIELSKKAGLTDAAKQGGAGVDRLGELSTQIKALESLGSAISTVDQITLIDYQGQYDALKRAVTAGSELSQTLAESGKAASDLRQKLTGVSDTYITDLAKLKKGLDDGLIGQADYIKAVKKLAADTFNGSEAGKDFAKTMDLASSAIARRAEAQSLLNQRDQEHIQFLKNTSQIDEEAAIRQTTKAQIDALGIEKSSLSQQLALAAKKTDSQKEQGDLIGKISLINTKVSNAKKKEDEDLFALEQQRYRLAVGNSADVIEKEMAELSSLQQQAKAQSDLNEQIGMTPKQIAAVTAAYLEQDAARKDAEAVIAEGLDLTGERAERVRAQAAAIRARATAVVDGAAKQELFDKNLQDANALVDIMSALDEAAQSAAQGMAKSFGSVGEAIGGMTTALTGFERTQAAIAAQLISATKDAHGDPTKIARANQMAAEASAQAQVKSYGDMAGAAKGFFDENSKGYAVLNDVEKAYRAAEMVMALESMTKKIFFKETEVAANTALNATKLTGEAAASTASVGLAATESSAWGVTAVVKAIASLPFPLNLAAGAATLAAVVGIGAKIMGSVGGSSVSLSEQRQKTQGTGSVLGDSDAKSESIKHAIEAVEKNTYQGLAINTSMLATLRSIDTNISSFASQLVRTTDITNPDVGTLNSNNGGATTALTAVMGGAIGLTLTKLIPGLGNVVGKIATSIFGGKQSVEDSGFRMDATSLASILSNGAHAFQYADIKTSGGWFSSDKHSEQSNPLSDAANQQFTSIITSLADSIKTAGGMLGLCADDFTNKLNSFVVDIGHVSLKDLKGDDLQKALESVFSKLGDDMAQYAVGGLQELQQVGEGYLETLVRVASEYQTVDVVFQSFGKTFGKVGLESIAARDRLVQLAGGLDKFTSQGEYFLTNFFSEQEQAAALKARIDPTLAQYGLTSSGENAMKMFQNFIVCLDTTTEAGAKAYTELTTIAPAFKTVVDAQRNAANDLLDIQAQIYKLMNDKVGEAAVLERQHALALADLSPAMKLATQKLWDLQAAAEAIDKVKSDGSALLNNVDNAFSVLQGVVGREKELLQKRIDKETEAVTRLKSLTDSISSTLDSLKAPGTEVARRQSAQAEIKAALGLAKGGGLLSDDQIKSLSKAFSTVTEDSTEQFSSYTDYLRDLYQTKNDIAALGDVTGDQLTTQQSQLDMDKRQVEQYDLMLAKEEEQVNALKGISTIGLNIEQALQGLGTAILGAQGNASVAGLSAIGAAYHSSLGRAPDSKGLDFWQDKAAAGVPIADIIGAINSSPEAQVQKLYHDMLGRSADAGGLSFWLRSGASMDAIKSAMMASDEYKTHQKVLGVPGFANGGDFGGGIRAVGEVGVEIEATGPSRIHSTQALMDALRNPSSNIEVLAAAVERLSGTVDRQNIVIEEQGAALDQIQRNTRRFADSFDVATNGGDAMRTKEQVS